VLEADRLCNAQRYERSAARRDTRAGHYERNLQTKAGEVRLKVPKASPSDVRDGDHRALPAA
jgi:transposase-like protein